MASLADQLALGMPCLHLPKLELQVTTMPTWYLQGFWGSKVLLFSMKQSNKNSSVEVGEKASELRAWLVLFFSSKSGLNNEASIIAVLSLEC